MTRAQQREALNRELVRLANTTEGPELLRQVKRIIRERIELEEHTR